MSLGSARGNDFGLLSPLRDNVHAEAAITSPTSKWAYLLPPEPFHRNHFVPNFKIQDVFPPYLLHSALKLPKLIAPLIYAVSVAAGLEILGHEMKELIQGARNLRQLGIEELGLPLPKLIVVGDQSTGKSSLIEGIRSAIEFTSKKIRFLTNLGEM